MEPIRVTAPAILAKRAESRKKPQLILHDSDQLHNCRSGMSNIKQTETNLFLNCTRQTAYCCNPNAPLLTQCEGLIAVK